MTDLSLERAAEDEMVCPTCKARQAWSDQCRRCKCDLSLLRQWQNACESQRRQCLRQLRAGRPDQALRHAQHYALMAGVPQASRLLAVCHLLCSNWRESCDAFGEAATSS